jgi:hypothetical protein
MRYASLDVDERTGKVALEAAVFDDGTAADNARLRAELGKGYTTGKTMRAVADIPVDFLQMRAANGDRDAVTLYNVASSPQEKRRALRRFIYRYPQFRISSGNI